MEWISPLEQSFIEKGWQKGLKQGLQRGLEQGLEQGLEKGLEQGRKQGALVLLEQQLTHRFGPIPKRVHDRLAKASLDELSKWGNALPQAQSLKQLLE